MLAIVGIGRAFLTIVRNFLWNSDQTLTCLPIELCWQNEHYSCFYELFM